MTTAKYMDQEHSRLYVLHGWYHCGACDTQNVRIMREHREEPWHGLCVNCGSLYPVIKQVDDARGKYTLGSDTDMLTEGTPGMIYNLGQPIQKTGDDLADTVQHYRRLVDKMRAARKEGQE